MITKISILEKNLGSIFDIAGSDENALTKSFGVILRKDKTLFSYFISSVIKRTYSITKRKFNETEFHFEKSHAVGRTDIEISNDKLHVIIESKIGTNEVKLKQAKKYSEILNRSTSKLKCFIFLTEIGNLVIDNKLKSNYPNIKFANISWDSTLNMLKKRKSIAVNLVEEYENYLMEGMDMKIYDIDIWAVVVRGEQRLNFDDNNYYINSNKHSPIFIGKREWDKKFKKVIVKELRPVLKVHDPSSKKGKNNGKKFVYDMGRKLILDEPIIKKFGQASAISVSFAEI